MELKVPFEIDYPLKILDPSKKIDFNNKKAREDLFKRNIYYYKYGGVKNELLEQRHEKYSSLSERLLDYMGKNHPSLDVLNISIFGSSLFLKNPGDFDFLTIVKGNEFSLDESKFLLRENESVPVGISIKGIDNFVNGFSSSGLEDPKGRLEPIIDRTAISLFRRHLPIFGNDFVDNIEVFSKNVYGQVSDLLHNSYDLYYLKNKRVNLSETHRARKILSRLYEGLSYMGFLEEDPEVEKFRKEVYSTMMKKPSLPESKRIFNEISNLYKTKVIDRKLLKRKKEDNHEK